MEDLEKGIIAMKGLFKDIKKGNYDDLLEFTLKQFSNENSVPDVYHSSMIKHWYDCMVKSLDYVKQKYNINNEENDYQHFFGDGK